MEQLIRMHVAKEFSRTLCLVKAPFVKKQSLEAKQFGFLFLSLIQRFKTEASTKAQLKSENNLLKLIDSI